MHSTALAHPFKRAYKRSRMLCVALGLCGISLAQGCHHAPKFVPPIQALAARETPMAMWVTDLGLAGQHTDAYLKALTRRAGSHAIDRLRQNVITQLGFDPLSAKSMQEAGLRPEGGVMLWREPGLTQPLLALPCADSKKLEATLQAIIARRDGATNISRATIEGIEVTTVGRPFGQTTAPSAHWAQVSGYTVLAQGEGLAALQALIERRHRLGNVVATNAADAIGAPDVQELPAGLGYLSVQGPPAPPPPGAKLGPQPQAAPEAPQHRLTASWRWDEQGFAADMRLRDAHLSHDKLSAMFGGAPVGPLAGVIDEDAWALWLTRAARAGDMREHMQANLSRLEQMGLAKPTEALFMALHEAIAPALAGPCAISLHPRPQTSAAHILGQMQRPLGLTQYMQMAAVADIEDADMATAALASLPKMLEPHQLKVTSEMQQVAKTKTRIYKLEGLGAEMAWAIYNKRLVWAWGEGRLTQTLETLAKGPTSLGQAEAGSVMHQWHQTPGALFVMRAAAIAHSIEAMTKLPGPNGAPATPAGLGAIVSSVADVLRTLGDIAVGISDDSVPGPDSTTPLGAPMRVSIRQQMQ